MRQSKAMLEKEKVLLGVSSVVMILILIGTFFYHYIEKLSWLDSFYFTVITLTTVGYGDISPQTDLGKVFTIVYALAGIGILMVYINAFGERRLKRRIERSQRNKKKSNDQL